MVIASSIAILPFILIVDTKHKQGMGRCVFKYRNDHVRKGVGFAQYFVWRTIYYLPIYRLAAVPAVPRKNDLHAISIIE